MHGHDIGELLGGALPDKDLEDFQTDLGLQVLREVLDEVKEGLKLDDLRDVLAILEYLL